MSVTIKNLKFEKPSKPWQVRVDRKSILGNPFYMSNESLRDWVCDKYIIYFNKKVENDITFKNELLRLKQIYLEYGKLELFCWCAPKRCHAQTIAKYIEEVE